MVSKPAAILYTRFSRGRCLVCNLVQMLNTIRLCSENKDGGITNPNNDRISFVLQQCLTNNIIHNYVTSVKYVYKLTIGMHRLKAPFT